MRWETVAFWELSAWTDKFRWTKKILSEIVLAFWEKKIIKHIKTEI